MSHIPNFASILDEAPSEVDRPKPLPAGTYTCIVAGTPIYDKSSKRHPVRSVHPQAHLGRVRR